MQGPPLRREVLQDAITSRSAGSTGSRGDGRGSSPPPLVRHGRPPRQRRHRGGPRDHGDAARGRRRTANTGRKRITEVVAVPYVVDRRFLLCAFGAPTVVAMSFEP